MEATFPVYNTRSAKKSMEDIGYEFDRTKFSKPASDCIYCYVAMNDHISLRDACETVNYKNILNAHGIPTTCKSNLLLHCSQDTPDENTIFVTYIYGLVKDEYQLVGRYSNGTYSELTKEIEQVSQLYNAKQREFEKQKLGV